MVSGFDLYCMQCGAANMPGANFCVACGHSLQMDQSRPLYAIPKTPLRVAASVPSCAPNSLLKQRYRILTQIGKGGFGEVFKATDRQFGGRVVAIKSMGLNGMSPQESVDAVEAFEREALMLAGLMHPNLPSIYDYFGENGRWYLVMSFIDGMTLEHYLAARGGRLPVEKVLPIGIQLCSVLSYLHKRQPPIIFRDLKPANVMRTPDRQLYLIDFGVARFFKRGQMRDTVALGSPGYAAPEQYGKAQTTAQADIYSLGATLHQLLSGIDPADLPFTFAPLHTPAYPDLNTLIMSMIEMDPRKRPISLTQVKQELQRIALGPSAEWAQQNWQNNVLHFADVPKQSPPPPHDVPGLKPLQPGRPAPHRSSHDVPGSRSPQSVRSETPRSSHDVPGLRPLQSGRPQAPRPVSHDASFAQHVHSSPFVDFGKSPYANNARQQMFQSSAPQLSSSGRSLSRRNVLIGGVVGLLATGSLFTCALMNNARSQAVPGNISTQAKANQANQIPATPALASNPAMSPVALLAVAWSPDGNRLVAGGGASAVHVFDQAGNMINAYTGHLAAVSALSWSPDGKRVASASYDTTVQIWDPKTDKTLATYRANVGSVQAMAWSPLGNHIASADYAHNVLVWDANNIGQTFTTYSNHTDEVRSVAWSPTSLQIASGSADQTVQIWDPMSGTLHSKYQGHSNAVQAVAWAPDGVRIASASQDQTVRVWDAMSGNHLTVYTHHTDTVQAVAWSPNGRYIASASFDKTVQVWDTTSSQLIYIYSAHTNAVLSVSWSPSGHIVSVDADGHLHIWEVPAHAWNQTP